MPTRSASSPTDVFRLASMASMSTVIVFRSPRSARPATAPPRRRGHRRATLLPLYDPCHMRFLSAIGALSRSSHREQANRQEHHMKHRIIVLGAGYAGAYVAGNLTRRLSPADTEITVVNAVPHFVQRLRGHQLAAGQEIEAPQLADVFADTGIRLRLARVTAIDPERQVVAVADADGTENGQIVVDRTMRSVSHPNVYAVGDSVHAIGDNGRPLPMSCASAGYTGRQVIDAIVGRLTGRKIPNTKLVYTFNHISLGRRDGILQPVDDEAQAKPKYMGGRKAARIKSGILKGSLWATSHPTLGMPKRQRRLAAAPDGSAEKAVA
ncbi:FAD-dependent oxidoreductase [Streptomyces sp. NPDC048411]|uniref:FAD-dependent oxidoreductase n=1 Tax=Streptomyces sp. NPDC048411 TaxID=3157206 RepID=UPI0034566AB6